jgi:hypothetical protein
MKYALTSFDAILDDLYPRGADGWRRPSEGPMTGVPMHYDGQGIPTVPNPPAPRRGLNLAKLRRR